MKPPKVTNTPKRLSPQQWYDQNIQSGNKLTSDYPDLQQQLGMGKYFTFYNPNEYSKHPDGGFRNLSNPNAKVGDPDYNPIINYQAPAPVVTPQKTVVNVSPDHKPVEIGPNLTYNPNMGTYSNSQTGKGVGELVQQYKAGGLVKKIQGYAGGGTTGYSEQFQLANQLAADQKQQKKQNAKSQGLSSSQKLTGLNLAGQGLNAIGGPADTDMQYGSNAYFDNRNKQMAQGQGLANAAGSVPIIGAFKSIGEGAQNAIAKKDAYGVSDAGDLSVAAGGFANPLESTTSAFNDIKSGKVTKQTAANLILPGLGAVMMNKEKKKQRDLLQSQQAQQLENDQKQQQAIAAQGRLSGVQDLRNAGETGISDNYSAPADNSGLGMAKSLNQSSLNQTAGLNNAFGQDASLGTKVKGFGKLLGFKSGGLVTGPGSAKSDSIKAKVAPGSFVVPAENVPIAKEIKEKILLKAPNIKANLNQKGGQTVNLSNGEMVFNPGEISEIEASGINKDALAPNAQRATPNGGKDLGYYGGGTVADRKKAAALREKQDNYKYLKSRIDNRSATPQERVAYDRLGKELNSKPTVTGVKAPKVNRAAPTQSNNLSVAEMRRLTPGLNEVKPGNVVPENNLANSGVKINTTTNPNFDYGLNTTGSNDNTFAADKPVANKRNGINLDSAIDYGIPLVQAGLGLNYLNKAGKRPVDQLDPDYLRSIESARGNLQQAQQNAKFGFTPEEQASINLQNQNLTNAGNYAARNFSGGSSGNAFNLTRANLNDSYGRGLESKVQNRNLIFQKQNIANDRQAYLDSLINNKVGMSNRLFNMKLDAWNTNQQTGSGLVAAGLQNAIGAKRWNDELQLSKDRAATYNPQYPTI